MTTKMTGLSRMIFMTMLLVPLTTQARLPIEELQREFQARHVIAKGSTVDWPPCTCGSAPAYPKNEFYGDLDKNKALAILLVQDLSDKFYSTAIIYDAFVKTTDGSENIEGEEEITHYEDSDFPPIPPDTVTTNNVEPVFNLLKGYILKLNYLDESASKIDLNWKWTGTGLNEDDSCVPAVCVSGAHGSTPWGHAYGYFSNCSDHGDSPVLTEFNTNVIQVLFNTGSDCIETHPTSANVLNVRGKIQADLSKYTNGGTAKIFLKLGFPSYTGVEGEHIYSSLRPIAAEMGRWGCWPEGHIELGQSDARSDDFVKYSDDSDGTPLYNCAAADDEDCDTFSLGWAVGGQVIIVRPNWYTTPDPIECGGGGCSASSCSGQGTAGSVGAGTGGSAFLQISLGPGLYGKSAGYLYFHAEQPSAALYTPAGLSYSLGEGSSGSPGSGWIYTANITASFETFSGSYRITFRDTSEQFISSVTITNDNGDNNKMIITNVIGSGGSARVIRFNYTTDPDTWTMIEGGDMRTESRAKVWETATNETDTILVKNADTVTVAQTIEKYRIFPWGRKLVERISGSGGSAKTNMWTYYEDAGGDGVNYGLLKKSVEPTGRWQRYKHDEFGQVTNTVTQFANNASNTADTANRVTLVFYTNSVIATIEKLLDQEIGRTFVVDLVDDVNKIEEVQTIQCQTAGAAINDAANLTNIVRRATDASVTGTAWEALSERHADGTMSFYSYDLDSPETGQKTTVIKTGKPNDTFDDIEDGTETTTIVGLWGELLSSEVRTIIDGDLGPLISSETYAYDPDDVLKRSHKITYLDDTSHAFVYDCCGLQWETNRDGTVTQHFYDNLKRQTASRQLQLGITVTNALDANANVLRTIRNPGGSEIVMHQAKYDLAGQTTRETNALNGVTVYTNFFDGSYFVESITYPDTGARVETYFQDGSIKSVTGTAVFPVYYGYGADGNGAYTIQTNGSSTGSEWTKTYTDMMGRVYKTVYASASGTPFAISYFNSIGQLTNQVDPDGVSLLYAYNPNGELAYTVTDSNRNYSIDLSGPDRITHVTNDVVESNGTDVRRTSTYVWDTGSTPKLIRTTETSVDGLQSWNTVWNNGDPVTSHSAVFYDAAHGLRVVTNTAPDNSYTVTSNQYDRLVSVTRYPATGGLLNQTTYGYDTHGRQYTATDARNGTTTYWFNNADQVSGIRTPDPGTGAQVTTNYFDNMGRIWKTTLPDNTSVTNNYNVTGLMTNTCGSRTYPVAYTYDAAGRMKTMKTWTNFPSGNPATTTWNYDICRGWLTNKTYDGGVAGPTNTYTAAGRLASRAWARGVTTTYSYNYAGDLSGVNYSDATPDVTCNYDRRGRQISIAQSGGTTTTRTYNDASQWLTESYSGGPLSGLSVTNSYDSLLRRNALGLASEPSPLTQFGYDEASRLSTVTNGSSTATYSYVANSPLVDNIVFKQSGSTRMTTTKRYDVLNRLTSITNGPSGALAIGYRYAYNAANQRTSVTNADTARWVYTYDALGQVISGKKYWSDGTPVAGQQFEYTFDDIGNRKTSKSGGDSAGANLRSASYAANALNQYTARDVPGYVNVLGDATNTATVTVNVQMAYRKDRYYRAELSVANSANPVWLTVTNLAVMPSGAGAYIVSNVTGNVFVPKTQEVFYYDLDGNLTNDGRWMLTWDAENRLTKAESLASGPSASKRKVTWEFDGKGRRVRQTTYDGSSGSYVVTEDLKFVSDGLRHVAELNATNNALVRSYVWGLDLSGSLDGAGGVGGLLMINSVANGVHFYAYDGNGNVAALVKASDGVVSQNCEYDPFGKIIRNTGLMADENRFLFSTKRCDRTTDFELYEYRVRHPEVTWLSRDPIGERGDRNLFVFISNQPQTRYDPLGLKSITLVVGFDSSAEDNKAVKRIFENEKRGLEKMLNKCRRKKKCECSNLKDGPPTVKSFYDDERNKSAPSDEYDLTVPGSVDQELMDANLEKVMSNDAPNPTLRIVATKMNIRKWTPAIAATDSHGTLFNLNLASRGWGTTIAHEIGHFAGYHRADNPSDPAHAPSTERDNLMFWTGGIEPDCQWCQIVSNLAK